MKPIFCGNLEYDARPSELERLFKRYGKVERVDVKSVLPPSSVVKSVLKRSLKREATRCEAEALRFNYAMQVSRSALFGALLALKRDA
ncbi:hypothetical protein AgCh_034156 [Apium graveolens]